ncbi:MAG: right-handed parallel beta-helix repeat-containing protein [Planctomycetes bacterium]|nr:right-handed parallel beta-helix repeat-containing protein [Planctomycetota bacterium]
MHPTISAFLCIALPATAQGADVRVRDSEALRRAASGAAPGTRILLEPGEYAAGIFLTGLKGEAGKPIVIAGADRERPPVIRGGGTGMQLTDPVHVELADLVVTGASANGINIDDGGSYDTPARHVVLRRLRVTDVGPRGNHDGIKLSGLDDFRVEDCAIERWGTGGGSAIDMVGCHRGVIEGNTLRHTDEEGSTGIQAKGGSSAIAIRGNRFERAGGRAVNIGGSTGLQYFRPPLREGDGERFEAREILVEGNTFTGGGAPVAFVGADACVVRFNTIYRPRRWALRILQETREPGFAPCRRGELTDNIVAFRAGEWGGAANVGPATAPETFAFARNVWHAIDEPARSRVKLPAAEKDGSYGVDPLFIDPEKGDLRLRPESPARAAGAQALPHLERALRDGDQQGRLLEGGARAHRRGPLRLRPPQEGEGESARALRDWRPPRVGGGSRQRRIHDQLEAIGCGHLRCQKAEVSLVSRKDRVPVARSGRRDEDVQNPAHAPRRLGLCSPLPPPGLRERADGSQVSCDHRGLEVERQHVHRPDSEQLHVGVPESDPVSKT